MVTPQKGGGFASFCCEKLGGGFIHAFENLSPDPICLGFNSSSNMTLRILFKWIEDPPPTRMSQEVSKWLVNGL